MANSPTVVNIPTPKDPHSLKVKIPTFGADLVAAYSIDNIAIPFTPYIDALTVSLATTK